MKKYKIAKISKDQCEIITDVPLTLKQAWPSIKKLNKTLSDKQKEQGIHYKTLQYQVHKLKRINNGEEIIIEGTIEKLNNYFKDLLGDKRFKTILKFMKFIQTNKTFREIGRFELVY